MHDVNDKKLTTEWEDDREERKRTRGRAGGSCKEEEGWRVFTFPFL